MRRIRIVFLKVYCLGLLFHSNTFAQPLNHFWEGIQKIVWGAPESGDNDDVDELEPLSPRQPMLVIGAGLPRTGTGSLHRAISLLGYRSYHMMSVLGDDAHAKQWADLADGAASFNDTAQFISRQAYNATLDYPTSDYVAEYLQLYPDAKVILSVRDNATAWAQSYQLLNRLVLTMERSFTWTYPNWIPLLIPEKAANIRKMRCILGTNTVRVDFCARSRLGVFATTLRETQCTHSRSSATGTVAGIQCQTGMETPVRLSGTSCAAPR